MNKQGIFFDENDYKHFQRLLYTRNSQKRIDSSLVKGLPFHKIDRGETIVDIVAYALMPNHFHLLLHEKQSGGISSYMSKLGTAHAMYINAKYDRSGPLMCRPFRSKYVDSDEYLRWIVSYIHLNPADLNPDETDLVVNYKFSSYLDYFKSNEREQSLLLNKTILPFDISETESVDSMQTIVNERTPLS